MSLSLVANALPQITRSGKYLYEPDGTRFYIKVGQLSHRMTDLTFRVSHINLKALSPSRAPPTPKSEPSICSGSESSVLIMLVVVSPNRMSSPHSQFLMLIV
jgi:hypothetical protein